MKRLLSSKAGFVFLILSVVFAGSFFIELRMSWPNSEFSVQNGAIGAAIPRNLPTASGLPRFSITFNRIQNLAYGLALWPAINRYEQAGLNLSVIFIPIWFFLLPSALASWLFYHRARRKRLIGHCPKCEYDLTGNTSGVCPECGERI